MREHSKPGEGILSVKAHKKLTDLLLGYHTTLSVYSISLVYLYALVQDRELNNFVLSSFSRPSEFKELEITALILLGIAALASMLYVIAIIGRVAQNNLVYVAANVIIALLTLFVAVEYFFEIAPAVGKGNTLAVVLTHYYMVTGLAFISVSINDRSYLKDRINLDAIYSRRTLIVATFIPLAISFLFLSFLDDVVYSWAYALTLTSIVMASLNKIFKIDN